MLPANVKTSKSYLSQLVDVLQEDISASSSRRKYQHFVTGATNSPGVTSSLFQTIHDTDFSLQTANPIFDLTIGLFPDGTTVATSKTGTDAANKELFPSSSLMMREKMDIYRQFAQSLLGDSTLAFTAALDSSDVNDQIDVAMFVAFKRLFARDSIKRETFAMRFFQSASAVGPSGQEAPYTSSTTGSVNAAGWHSNLTSVTTSGTIIVTDIGASTNKLSTFGGQVGNIVDSSNTSKNVGLMFYDRGIAVFDLKKITSASQFVSGTIDAIAPLGQLPLGAFGTENASKTKFIPDFIVSGSIDNIVDHLAGVRFGSGSQTSITFQNVTNINSTLIFCEASADEFNYSSNPSFTDSDGRIKVIDAGSEDVQSSFTFITKIGLYDASDNLLAVASLSRPIEKANDRSLSFRVRLDF